jgi:hypothetical protein
VLALGLRAGNIFIPPAAPFRAGLDLYLCSRFGEIIFGYTILHESNRYKLVSDSTVFPNVFVVLSSDVSDEWQTRCMRYPTNGMFL